MYNILNIRELSPDLVAVLLLGLDGDSRTKRKMSGTKLSMEQMLMAMILDNLNFLSWTKTKDAKHGKYKGKSVLKSLLGEYEKQKDDLLVFNSIEDYEEHMKQFIK